MNRNDGGGGRERGGGNTNTNNNSATAHNETYVSQETNVSVVIGRMREKMRRKFGNRGNGGKE